MFSVFASCHKIVLSPKIVLRLSVNLGPDVAGMLHIHWWVRLQPEPYADSVTAATLLCMLTMCIKLYIIFSLLMSVIWCVFLLLLHTAR